MSKWISADESMNGTHIILILIISDTCSHDLPIEK